MGASLHNQAQGVSTPKKEPQRDDASRFVWGRGSFLLQFCSGIIDKLNIVHTSGVPDDWLQYALPQSSYILHSLLFCICGESTCDLVV